MTYDLDLGLIRLLSPKPQGFQQLTLVPFATNDLVFVASPWFYSTNRSRAPPVRRPCLLRVWQRFHAAHPGAHVGTEQVRVEEPRIAAGDPLH